MSLEDDEYTSLAILMEDPIWPDNLFALIEEDPEFALRPIVSLWEELEKKASFYKDAEMRFRRAIDKRAFPTGGKLGVNYFELSDGRRVKATHKENVKVDEAMFPTINQELAAIGAALNPFLKAKYELNAKTYSMLVDHEKDLEVKPIGDILRKMITTTPSAPTVEVVAKKGA